ncbi:hypothetical protein OPV22_016548 [Ensete ventricosum]|uniref:Sugar phosphate transporter domain-containing protein n=1 Tax=Ensete ventricosum TaxID=4639 RepID=A0AAV8QV93_ENSVE|nr:hypothetical protein OPV22_016548 [Ensete ventricosum]
MMGRWVSGLEIESERYHSVHSRFPSLRFFHPRRARRRLSVALCCGVIGSFFSFSLCVCVSAANPSSWVGILVPLGCQFWKFVQSITFKVREKSRKSASSTRPKGLAVGCFRVVWLNLTREGEKGFQSENDLSSTICKWFDLEGHSNQLHTASINIWCSCWLLCFCIPPVHNQQMGRHEVSLPSLDLITMWKFLPAAVIFYLSLFTNSELLLHANVDTFIVFRSAVPMFVAVGETVFLNQPWPSPKTWISLTTIFGGSVIYVLTDYQFTVTAYAWAAAYLVSMSIDFVYIKHVVMTIGLNTWGLVLYNNLEALMLFPLELLIMGELKKIKHDISDESNWYSFSVVLPVSLSCLFGLAISFFGFSCRRAISATGFTVLGIVNKLLTVVINLVIWDNHSTLIGTIGLLICMFGGVLYQQSTTKPKNAETEPKSQIRDEEQQQLLEMQATAEADSTKRHVVSVDPK